MFHDGLLAAEVGSSQRVYRRQSEKH
jgi:hypothetical protein